MRVNWADAEFVCLYTLVTANLFVSSHRLFIFRIIAFGTIFELRYL